MHRHMKAGVHEAVNILNPNVLFQSSPLQASRNPMGFLSYLNQLFMY